MVGRGRLPRAHESIHLLPIGSVDGSILDGLRIDLKATFKRECQIASCQIDLDQAFHPGRQQYWSSQLLASMQPIRKEDCWRLLAITSLDLYIPILTFVFGEAQLEGPCAIISTHRLRQEFYGLPPDHNIFYSRALKEAVHELGHTLALSHCEDYQCAMAPSHSVEWIDLKSSEFCDDCKRRAHASRGAPHRYR